MFIATLIAADRLEGGELSLACDILYDAGCEPSEPDVFCEAKAADIGFIGEFDVGRLALTELHDRFDVVVQSAQTREKKLLISDMDSTMITVECIDELADYAGLKAEISDITERAMLGELDFEQALHSRVALLEGLDARVIQECLAERVTVMPGANILVQTMKKMGAETILVSGGFTDFASPVADWIGFDHYFANQLGIIDGELSGVIEGSIVDSTRKVQVLLGAAAENNIDLSQTLAVGDGANDIPMLQRAGLGIAYHAKPAANAAADGFIAHNDLTALLYAQGIAAEHWETFAEDAPSF